MGVITLLLGAMEEDKDKFVKTLQGLARVHNIIGVKAVECKWVCSIACIIECLTSNICVFSI